MKNIATGKITPPLPHDEYAKRQREIANEEREKQGLSALPPDVDEVIGEPADLDLSAGETTKKSGKK